MTLSLLLARRVKRYKELEKLWQVYPIKGGCFRCFVAKRPYLDGSLCQLIYEHIEHTNQYGKPCHGSTMVDFIMQLGSNIFEDMKLRIEQMHALELSPTQIMSQHEQNVKELAKCNERLIMDIFVSFRYT